MVPTESAAAPPSDHSAALPYSAFDSLLPPSMAREAEDVGVA